MKQDISALMDGELDPYSSEQSIQACCKSEELKQAWNTYHLIGEALRRDGCRDFDISKSVMAELEKEPAIIARPRKAPVMQRVAIAAAASALTLGMVAWIGTQGFQGSGPAATVASSAPQAPAGAVITTASGDGTQQATPQAVTQTQVVSYPAIEVQDYLAAHRQIPTPDLYRTVAARQPAKAP